MNESNEQDLERWRYDVFMSFRGVDTRKTFSSHLYRELQNRGIKTFKDDQEMPTGGIISSELREAIESSKILLVVFSKTYASSSWCLDELLHIMKCGRDNSRQVFIPIFYDIDPSDIRKQKGPVAESFARHESRFLPETLQSWRHAMNHAASIAGYDVSRWSDEADCVGRICDDIWEKLDPSSLHVASYPVGLGPRVFNIGRLLLSSSNDVQIVGICGMGGIGKTTIAKAAFNEFSYHFEGKSFLADIREYSKTTDGKNFLLQKLQCDILKRRKMEINVSVHEIRRILNQRKVLVVIDDVEEIDQLKSLPIDLNCFGQGSRIMVTTRNTHLLKQLQVKKIYFPVEFDARESLELLSWHAFRISKPPEEFLELSRNVVKYCGGLPLAVEVLGAFLFGRSIFEWEDTLELLKRAPNDDIQKKLQISFDALSDVNKDIFLDIACFFIGLDKDYVTYILDGCGFCPGIGLSVLMERCLISVSANDNRLMMHDLLRDMGRDIVKKESSKICGKRSRLWDPDDIVGVLTSYSGTEVVEGLSLKGQGLDVEDLDADAFSYLRNMRLLQLSHVQINGSYECFPKGLRWLHWHGFSLGFIPMNLNLRRLVVMEMQHSNLRRLWPEAKGQCFEKLRFLDLSHSLELRESPDFSYLPNLEKLLLVGCKSLVLIHRSIGILCEKLVLANLKYCTELEDLPAEFYKLKSLKTLVISGCSKFQKLDDALGEMAALTTLLADYTAIQESPSSIFELKKLVNLSLSGCKASREDDLHSQRSPQPSRLFPVSSEVSLRCLRTLRLSHCNLRDGSVPQDLRSFPCLEELDLQGNNFHNLQTDFGSLQNLWIL